MKYWYYRWWYCLWRGFIWYYGRIYLSFFSDDPSFWPPLKFWLVSPIEFDQHMMCCQWLGKIHDIERLPKARDMPGTSSKDMKGMSDCAVEPEVRIPKYTMARRLEGSNLRNLWGLKCGPWTNHNSVIYFIISQLFDISKNLGVVLCLFSTRRKIR